MRALRCVPSLPLLATPLSRLSEDRCVLSSGQTASEHGCCSKPRALPAALKQAQPCANVCRCLGEAARRATSQGARP